MRRINLILTDDYIVIDTSFSSCAEVYNYKGFKIIYSTFPLEGVKQLSKYEILKFTPL